MSFKTTLYQLIGSRIKKMRIESKLSQDELASKIDLTRASVSNIEIGRQQVTLSILYQISQALSTEVHFLLPTYNEVTISESKTSDPIELLKTKNVADGSKIKIEDLLNNLGSNKV